MSVGGIILAAGQGARMGRPKQLAPLEGRSLLQHVIDAAVAAPLDGIVVVLATRRTRWRRPSPCRPA